MEDPRVEVFTSVRAYNECGPEVKPTTAADDTTRTVPGAGVAASNNTGTSQTVNARGPRKAARPVLNGSDLGDIESVAAASRVLDGCRDDGAVRAEPEGRPRTTQDTEGDPTEAAGDRPPHTTTTTTTTTTTQEDTTTRDDESDASSRDARDAASDASTAWTTVSRAASEGWTDLKPSFRDVFLARDPANATSESGGALWPRAAAFSRARRSAGGAPLAPLGDRGSVVGGAALPVAAAPAYNTKKKHTKPPTVHPTVATVDEEDDDDDRAPWDVHHHRSVGEADLVYARRSRRSRQSAMSRARRMAQKTEMRGRQGLTA